jgi:3-hydroxyacyl-CoA dehydrogenase
VRKRRAVERPGDTFSQTADLLCEHGRFGQKIGASWYDYLPGKRDALPSAWVAQMIDAHRASFGQTPRKITDDEIVPRLVLEGQTI